MRKSTKLVILILAVIMLASATAVFALANDNDVAEASVSETKEPILPGYFQFYDASAGTAKILANTGFSGTLASAEDGDVITLLSDIYTESKSTITGKALADGSPQKKYVDLNGYSLRHHRNKTGQSFIEIHGNASVYVYSSDTDYKGTVHASNVSHSTGEDSFITMFAIRKSNSNFYIGSINDVPVISTENAANATAGKTYAATRSISDVDGNNMEFFGSALATTYKDKSEENIVDSTINISGIKFNQICAAGGVLTLYTSVDINLDSVTFVSASDVISSSIRFYYNNSVAKTPVYDSDGQLTEYGILQAPADANVYAKNCIFQANGTALTGLRETVEAIPDYKIKATEVVFDDCYFFANDIHGETDVVGTPIFKNCSFSDFAYDDGVHNTVLNNEKHTLKIPTHKFVYTNMAGSEGSYNADVDPSSYIPSYEYKERTILISTATADRTVEIAWHTPVKNYVESWFISDKTYPTPAVLPAPTKVCSYTFSPEISSTLESGDAEYTLDSTINFTIKANLALYSDFVYNLYIPKSAADDENFISARIDRINSDGTVSVGENLPVKGGTVTDITVAAGYVEQYYKLQKTILATNGDSNYRLVLTLNGSFGEEVTHVQEFSIFDYANRVDRGNYAENAKTMVASTVTYIKAARNYSEFIKNPDADLPYPVSENPDLSAAANSRIATKKADLSSEMSKSFYGMTLSLEESIKFRFYILPDTEDTITFIYPTNTKPTESTITVSDCQATVIDGKDLVYYDITMRALDLRSAIKIDLASTGEGVDYTYRLANYVYSVNGRFDALDSLMDTMFAYSVATNNYLRGETTDTPDVELSVAGNSISEETFEIVAGEDEMAAAETLKRAIWAKTGEELSIVSEATGKQAIYVNVTDPTINYDFEVKVVDGTLVFNSSFKSFLTGGVELFVQKYITSLSNSCDFEEGFTDSFRTDKIYYSDFGAYGVDLDLVESVCGKEYRNTELWYDKDTDSTITSDRYFSINVKPLLTNDFFNMKAAHDFANISRHTVSADKGTVYYISDTYENEHAVSITIKTPVIWEGAEIIIDDTDLVANDITGLTDKYKMGTTNIFNVVSNYQKFTISDSAKLSALAKNGLTVGTTKIDLDLGYPAMIIPYNTNHKVYRRKGYSAWAGESMHEIIVIDEYGNVDPSTPVMFDYTQLSYIYVYRLDIPELTIEGGTVTTISSSVNSLIGDSLYRGYLSRGLNVTRSNTTVKGVEHKVIGETPIIQQADSTGKVIHVSYCYRGFFVSSYASNITFENCILQGRRAYKRPTGGTGGTYDLSGTAVNNLTFKDCTQSNFWITVDTANGYEIKAATNDTPNVMLSMNPSPPYNGFSGQMHWGVGGTNYCKNMNYINSTLSRFDAHAGLYNGTIKDCTMNYMALTGGGEMLVENVTWYASNSDHSGNSILYLRNDYGSTWDGTITLRNVKAYHYTPTSGYVVSHTYTNWYFGYECAFPNLIIDNLEYYNINTGNKMSASERGSVQLIAKSLNNEPNLHLSNTANAAPYFEDRDENGDGLVDGTNIAFDSTVNDSGIIDKSSCKNLNPIKRPDFIRILNNNEGYDYLTNINSYLSKSTFLNETEIIFGTTDQYGNLTVTTTVNKGKTEDETPVIPFD